MVKDIHYTCQTAPFQPPRFLTILLKCSNGTGTLFHCMWECQELQIYWREVLDLISKVTDVAVPMNAELCLLYIPRRLTHKCQKTETNQFLSFTSLTRNSIKMEGLWETKL